MMRFIAVSLALLAGAKIWTQEQIYRSATEEALLHAYRSQAIASCRAAPLPAAAAASSVPTSRNQTRQVSHQHIASGFATPTAARLEIGNRDISVPIWEVDHAAWAMRYTYPYIVLETSTPGARCSYDVNLGRAQISLL